MKNWFSINAKANSNEVEVFIYDEIGYFGKRAKDFIAALKPYRDAGNSLHVRINSPGGDVFDGIAIGNYLATYPHAVRATVDGMAASIASVIAASVKKVTIAANAFLMIHNPWTIAMGDAEEFKKTADFLDKIRDSLVTTYEAKSGKDRDTIVKWMDAETWFNANEAKAAGLVDAIGDAAEAKAAFALDRFGALPDAVAQRFRANARTTTTPPEDVASTAKHMPLKKALVEAKLIPTDKLTDEEAASIFASSYKQLTEASAAAIKAEQEKVAALTKDLDAFRKSEAEAAVAAKVTDEKQRAALVAAYLKDQESAKAFLAAMPAPQAKKPGAEPIPLVAGGGAAPQLTGINRLAAALKRQTQN